MSDRMNEMVLALARSLEGDSESESAAATFNPALFWTINALWIGILLITCVWCWRCNGAQWMVTNFSNTNSDLAYRMRLHERRQAEIERNKVSPEKQRKILSEYFRSHKVHMVVGETDVNGETATQNENTTLKEPTKTEPGTFEPSPTDPSIAAASVSISDSTAAEQRTVEPSTAIIEPTVVEPIDVESGTLMNEYANSLGLDPSEQPALPTDIETGVIADRLEYSMTDRLDGSIIDLLDESIRSKTEGFLALRNSKIVPNCCAVCLGSYEVGEDVVWSNNCNHAFHEDCVTDWLIKMQSNHPCPCCRTPFVDIEAVKVDPTTSETGRPRTRRVTWEAGNTMNVGVIRFR